MHQFIILDYSYRINLEYESIFNLPQIPFEV